MSRLSQYPTVGVWGPGLLLGAGLGGFVDGIVLHQVLRWHHLLSARSPTAVEANLIADGIFHAATWTAVVVGLLLLWRRLRPVTSPPPFSALIGPMLAGWGVFNLVEGVVNHHLLGLHHVRQGPRQALYDVGFLVLGALLLAVGVMLHRQRPGRTDRTNPTDMRNP